MRDAWSKMKPTTIVNCYKHGEQKPKLQMMIIMTQKMTFP